MADSLLLGVGGLFIGLVALMVGYAIGQGTCRRMVRHELWRMFEAIEPMAESESPYTRGAMRWDVLGLIKKLEL